MAIRVTCYGCGKSFQTDDKWAGRSTACPACRMALIIPQLPVVIQPVNEWQPIMELPQTSHVLQHRPSAQPAASAPWTLLVGVGLACLALGYFLGREHVKWEAKSAITSLQQAIQHR